jgi:cytochrome c553
MWLHEAFVRESNYNDSRACLDCHNIGSTPLKQHGIEARQHVTPTVKASPFTDETPGIMVLLRNAAWEFPKINDDSLTCATCHGEHGDSNIALNAITNQTCLECHGDKFTSFSKGHPGYKTYPYKRRTRITFDHVRHFDKHFKADNDNENSAKLRLCGTCHQPDFQGKLMVLAPFEEACGNCHTDQIEGVGKATAKGIAILSLPDIDTWTLSEQTVRIGNWPEQTEGSLTPFMELLLNNNSEYQNVKLDLKNLDLTDLSNASPRQLAAVETLVWAVKDLFLQTNRLGAPYLRSQLESVLGPLTTMEAATLTASISKGVIQGAQNDWLPNVEHEMALRNSGQPVPAISENSSPLPEPNIGVTKNELDLAEEDLLLDEEIELDDNELDFAEEDLLLDEEIELDDNELDFAEEDILLLNSEDWAAAGGWYKDDNTYTLRYRPVSHADKFLKGWFDMSALMAGEAGIFADLFDSLSKKTSAGSCSKCHSTDRIDQNQLVVNWKGVSPETTQHNLTRYAHVSHFQVMDERGCETCHKISSIESSDIGSTKYDASIFESNFTVLNQEICADCHRLDTAMDSCITCHKYHFVRPQPFQPNTALLSGPE